MIADFKFPLGTEVKDRVSGLTGIINGRSVDYTGSKQLSVQPKGDGTELKSCYWIDQPQLETITLDPIGGDYNKSLTSTFKYEFLQQVKSKISDYEGVVVGCHEWLNGCKFYEVRSKKLDRNGQRVTSSLTEAEIQLVKENKTDIELPKTSRGGPSLPSMRGIA